MVIWLVCWQACWSVGYLVGKLIKGREIKQLNMRRDKGLACPKPKGKALTCYLLVRVE